MNLKVILIGVAFILYANVFDDGLAIGIGAMGVCIVICGCLSNKQ